MTTKSRPIDPWRRMLGLNLRAESSKFALSAFGLALPRDEPGLLEAFDEFLAAEPDAAVALESHVGCTVPRRTGPDLVFTTFGASDELLSLRARFGPRDPAVAMTARTLLCTAYNETRHVPEPQRGRAVERAVERALARTFDAAARNEAYTFARRVVRSAVMCWSPDDASRLAPPAFERRRGFGLGALAFVLRPFGDAVDVFCQAHHVAIDGAALGELLGRLEANFGVRTPLVVPGDVERPLPEPRALAVAKGERPLDLVTDFVACGALLEARDRLAQRSIHVPISALVLFRLDQTDEFRGKRFAVAVDVAPDASYARGVDLISIRPRDYDGSLERFANAFHAEVDAARRRETRTFATLQRIARLPSFAARSIVSALPDRWASSSAQSFGTVGFSMLRSAYVFVPPMPDYGFDDGFLAMGSMMLPGACGARYAAVSVKGPRGRLRGYPAAIRRALGGP